MTLKTKKPDYSSGDTNEKLTKLIKYVDELSRELEFRLETVTSDIEQLRQMSGHTYERR